MSNTIISVSVGIATFIICLSVVTWYSSTPAGESPSDFLVKKVYPILTCDQVQKLETIEPTSQGYDHPNLDNIYHRCQNQSP